MVGDLVQVNHELVMQKKNEIKIISEEEFDKEP